ncbi:MAG TPA: AraC family transcriptional regulator [Solimonas sp.]
MAGMPETWASARAIAQGQSSQREDSNLLAELQRCIRDALPDGGATLDAIAATLGFSERTLQRRLQSVQLNFQQLVERLRFEAACQYLLQGDLPLTEIGYQLGYSEPSAFSRAFRRWSGVSPLAYRRRS